MRSLTGDVSAAGLVYAYCTMTTVEQYLPLLIAGLGLVASLFLLRRYRSARQDARRLRLGSPTWLIPIQNDPVENTTASLGDEVLNRFNYVLDYKERERAETLERQVRRLARGLAVTGAVTLLGLGWFGVSQRMEPSQPTFVSQGTTTPTTQPPAPTADTTSQVADLPMAAPQKLPVRGVPTGTAGEARPTRQQTLAQVVAPAPVTPPPPEPAPAATVSTDTIATVKQQPLNVITPPPPPTATPATPAPDPAARSRAAAAVLQRGAVQAVAAINGADVAELRNRNGTSSGWSEAMLRSLQELKPAATLGDVAPPVLTGTDAETKFAVTFRWRANFGVNRSRTIAFAATARLEGDRWALVAVWPLEKFP